MTGKLALIVTGASKGLGRAIAKAFYSYQEEELEISAFLVARSADGLQQTEREMRALANENRGKITCYRTVADLGNLETLDGVLDSLLESVEKVLNSTPVDRIVLVNNAGSLGHVGPTLSSPSLAEMRRNVDLNVTSACWISVRFGRFCQQHSTIQATIVNISSLVALQVFPTMAAYSAGKAARDQYHAVMAKELVDTTKIKVLNYAPGPLETDMANELRSAPGLDDSLKPHFDKTLVDPNDSARVLVRLVMKDAFDSGAHVDYYDIMDDDKS